VSEWLG